MTAGGQAASTEAIVRDPAMLAHRYDPTHDAIHFLPVPREAHARATFINDEHLPKGLAPVVIGRRAAIAAAPPPAPIHFVFHSAFCCSTLVARAFDRPGWAMGLKEPVILNDIVGWRHRGGQGASMTQVMNDALTLLARPFEPGEAIVVKPSNVANGLAEAMLLLRPDARALLLYAPLRTYLGSIAKKGLDGRLWVRTLLLRLLDEKLIDLGFTARDHMGQTDLQVAAVGWLAQQALFARLVARFGAGRIRTLDSAHLMAEPRAAFGALARLFDRPIEGGVIDGIVAGPAFTRHSKDGTAFGADDRADEVSRAAQVHGDEIEKVAIWADAVAQAAGVALEPPAALLGSGGR